MPDKQKVIKGVEVCLKIPGLCNGCPYEKHDQYGKQNRDCVYDLRNDAIALLKDQDAKPLRCKECSYHRNDGWCNELGREVKESDFCSFGAWEGR